MRVLIAVAEWFAEGLYAVIKAVVPVRRRVVLLSRQSDAPSRDFVLLAEALRAADPALEMVVDCRTLAGSLWGRMTALPASIRQMRLLAGARVCVVDGYVIPVSVLTHRPGLFVMQTWHALGAVKKFGYQTLDRPGGRSSALAHAMKMHRNYDMVLCGSAATAPMFAEAFDVDESIVRPWGLPRVDYLLEHAGDASAEPAPAFAAELRGRFPVLADRARAVVLYAPTFRRGADPEYAEVVRAFADDRFALMVKPHPLESAHADGANVAAVGDYDVLDLLPLCDAVVTDYSAVAFEALVIGVPVYFFVHDIDAYRVENGLNIDPLAEVPEFASRDIDEIVGWIGSAVRAGADSEERFKQRYLAGVLGGGCTARIVDEVLRHVGSEGD